MKISPVVQMVGRSPVLILALMLVTACNFLVETSSNLPSTSTPSPKITLTPLSPAAVDAAETPQPIEPTPHPVTASATSTLTETPTQAQASSLASQTAERDLIEDPTALVLQNAFCRRGPGINYEPVTAYETGTRLQINGRNAGASWWRVQVDDTQTSCYISAILLQVDGNLDSVSEVPDPPTPIPTSTPTSTPVPPTSPPTPTLTPPTVIPPRKPPN